MIGFDWVFGQCSHTHWPSTAQYCPVLPSIGKCVLLRTFYNYLNGEILLESPQSSPDLLLIFSGPTQCVKMTEDLKPHLLSFTI